MADVNLINKHFVILGMKQEGKTVLARSILKKFPKHLVYDTTRNDYEGFDRYIPQYNQYSAQAIQEVNMVIEKLVIQRRVNLFIVDEANTYAPNKQLMPNGLKKVMDTHKHIYGQHNGMAFGVIARRPAQLNTDLIELAEYIFIFSLQGKNDLQYLDSLKYGLGDVVRNLEKYHFVFLNERRDIVKCSPISLQTDYIR
jgi:AAA+ ATPase superfamily predicted ATPase